MKSIALTLALMAAAGTNHGCDASDDELADSGKLVIKTVITKGEVAPETNGATFSSLSLPMIGPSGHVAFQGVLRKKDGLVRIATEEGLWIALPDDGETRLVARTGDAAPGCAGARFLQPYLTIIDVTSGGGVLFWGQLYRKEHGISEHEDEGIWINSANESRLVLREGHKATGSDLRIFWERTVPYAPSFALSDSGSLAFMSYSLANSGSGSERYPGIWFGKPGSLQRVARFGDPVPGIPKATFRRFWRRVGLSENDHIAFYATAYPVPDGEPFGIWAGTVDKLKLIVRGGDRTPGIPGALFSKLAQPYMNSNGDIVFGGYASLVDKDGMWKAIDGVWATSGGTIRVVARAEHAAPGLDGALFRYFYLDRSNPRMNSRGDVALLADLITGKNNITKANDTALWVEKNKELRLVAREGNEAPGTRGAVFDRFSDPTITRHGDVVFKAYLKKGIGDSTADNSSGLWRYSGRTQMLQLVVRNGNSLDVAVGGKVSQKIVSGIRFISGFSHTGGVNDAGAMTFGLAFTDDTSGIFVVEPR